MNWIRIKDNLINLDQVCYIVAKGRNLTIYYQANYLRIKFDNEENMKRIACQLQADIEYAMARNIEEININND